EARASRILSMIVSESKTGCALCAPFRRDRACVSSGRRGARSLRRAAWLQQTLTRPSQQRRAEAAHCARPRSLQGRATFSRQHEERVMTRFVFLFAWLFAAAAAAQDVGTTFTLGTPTANCIPLATQDGVSTNGQGAVCPNGFYGGGSLQISLPNDPVNPGNSVDMYACTATVISNT